MNDTKKKDEQAVKQFANQSPVDVIPVEASTKADSSSDEEEVFPAFDIRGNAKIVEDTDDDSALYG